MLREKVPAHKEMKTVHSILLVAFPAKNMRIEKKKNIYQSQLGETE